MIYCRPFLQEQVALLKVRVIVTNGVIWCQKCALERRTKVVRDPVDFKVRGRGMEAEGKLGGGGWWMRLLGAACGARVCVRRPCWLHLFEIRSRLLNE